MCLRGSVAVKGQMPGAVGRAPELEMAPAIEDRLGEIVVVEDPPPGGQRFVRREDHGSVMQVAVVDDLEQDIGRIGAVAETADLVDDQDVRVGVGGQDLALAAFAGGRGPAR